MAVAKRTTKRTQPASGPPILGARAIDILEAASAHASLIVAARDMREMRDLEAALRALAPDWGIAAFPQWDCLPCDHVSPSLGVMGERAGTLRWLASRGYEPKLLLTTVAALCQRVPPPETWATAHVEIRPGDAFDPDAMAGRLERLGYVREERVDEPGQFAAHGHTFDVYPAAAPRPCRVEYEDGRVTEIRSYDVDTQRSLSPADALRIDPASEIVVEEGAERPAPFIGEEHRLAAYYPTLVGLADYLPEAPILMPPEAETRAELFLEQVTEGCRIASRAPGSLYLDREEWSALRAKRSLPDTPAAPVEPIQSFARERRPYPAFGRYVAERREAGDAILLAGTGAAFERMKREAARATGVQVRDAAGWSEVAGGEAGSVLALSATLSAGFRMPDRRLTVITATDVAGRSVEQGPRSAAAIAFGDRDLQAGDVAIDRDHGLCVFEGLDAVAGEAGGSEALRLRFADGNVLMVPVEQADRIWRYGSEPEAVTLDRLGGTAWGKRRIEVEAAIAKTARAMTALAEARAQARTDPVLPDLRSMEQFAAGFRFSATADQAAAIDDVLSDLASDRPMDRLVCGDVGFGKTEVALRAVAAAVFAGRQAALVAPTTVLVRQHVETLRRRFARFRIEVADLSRLTPRKDADRVREGLADGTIKVVVGTQALAGKGVAFADLAVTVIDEEQRFGHAMKAKLRTLGRAAHGQPGHVLTLTATPIPRTLQQAMSGLQSMSLLVTPPAARQPIRTLVAPFDPKRVREALLRERARGGQSFVVCPRIEDLEPMAETLAGLVPELALSVAHGKLKAAEMDQRIVRFADGEGDVLLATTIVESGLDIPRANTMIICQADRFGLAALHQLRGRVGRGQRRGVVQLLTDPETELSPVARRRLATLEKLDRLGAGFAIAARDLDLRGAGDLVGEEQAGHVQKIGIGLYQHLLELAVASAAGEAAEDWSPEIVVGRAGRIPPDFVPDSETRLSLYMRLLRARNGDEIARWEEEVDDRFGTPPEDVADLIATARLRAACRRLGVAKLVAGAEGIAADLRGRGPKPERVVWKKAVSDEARVALAGRFLSRLAGGAKGKGTSTGQDLPGPRREKRRPMADGRAKAGKHHGRHAEEPAKQASRSTQNGGASFETAAAQLPQDDDVGRFGADTQDDDVGRSRSKARRREAEPVDAG